MKTALTVLFTVFSISSAFAQGLVTQEYSYKYSNVPIAEEPETIKKQDTPRLPAAYDGPVSRYSEKELRKDWISGVTENSSNGAFVLISEAKETHTDIPPASVKEVKQEEPQKVQLTINTVPSVVTTTTWCDDSKEDCTVNK